MYGELARDEFMEWLEGYLECNDESPDLDPIRIELERLSDSHFDPFEDDDA